MPAGTGRTRVVLAAGPPDADEVIHREAGLGGFLHGGPNFKSLQDIHKHVVDKGKSQTPKEKVGENLYNRGVVNSIIIAEAIRNAQKITGKKVINGDDMRRGLETLVITAARLKEIGLRASRRRSRSPARITTATTRPYMRSGTAPSGTRPPTGSRR